MVVNRHKYFRWTKRTAFLTTMYVVVVPATLGYFGYITEVSGGVGCTGVRRALMLGRASGISVERGGETLSLNFRDRDRGERDEENAGVCIIRQCTAIELDASYGRMNVSLAQSRLWVNGVQNGSDVS